MYNTNIQEWQKGSDNKLINAYVKSSPRKPAAFGESL